MARTLRLRLPKAMIASEPGPAARDEDDAGTPVDEAELASGPAGLGSRLTAYVLDSVFLFAFTMLFATASFLNIYLRSDSGRDNASDGTIWLSVYMLLLTVPAWFLFNLALTSRRGHTVGQYVMGLRLGSAGGTPLPGQRLAAYWLPMHQEELQVRADDRPTGAVPLSNVPIDAEIASTQVRDAAPNELRDRVVDAMGLALYTRGTDAFRTESGVVKLSVEEPVKWA